MNKHVSDLISLVFGVVLAGSGALLLVVDSPPDDFPAYAGPALIAVLGLLLLVIGAGRSGGRPVGPGAAIETPEASDDRDQSTEA